MAQGPSSIKVHIDSNSLVLSACVCVDQVPVVAFAIILFDLKWDSEGVEVAVRGTGQCCVPDVCRPGRTTKGCRETVQDATDLDGREQNKMMNKSRI